MCPRGWAGLCFSHPLFHDVGKSKPWFGFFGDSLTWADPASICPWSSRRGFGLPKGDGCPKIPVLSSLEQGFQQAGRSFLLAAGSRWTKALGWKRSCGSAGMWRRAGWFVEPVWSRVSAGSECWGVFTMRKEYLQYGGLLIPLGMPGVTAWSWRD